MLNRRMLRLLRRFGGALAAGAALLAAGAAPTTGAPLDWTHRHLVFALPDAAQIAQRPLALRRWPRLMAEPRFRLAVARIEASRRAPPASAWLRRDSLLAPAPRATAEDPFGRTNQLPRISPAPIRRDWSMQMAAGAATINPGQFPAKFAFTVGAAACDADPSPDFVAYASGTSGAGVASIIAYDNLYKLGCLGDTPMVYWQYDTGGAIPGSLVLSLDGTQLAFVQVTSGVASLVVLKWKRGATLATLTNTPAAAYRACAAPCMTALPLSGNPDAQLSSPYVDYNSDALFVGDDSGVLHKFVNIFVSGAPAEVGAPNWPVTAAGRLSSPVYDPFSDTVLVGSTNRRVYRLPAAGGAGNLVASAVETTTYGFRSPPLVDPLAGRAYFAAADTGSVNPRGPGVYQFAIGFAAGATSLAVVRPPSTVLPQSIGSRLSHAPVFDNAYYNSADPTNPSGALYFCGNTSSNPRVFRTTIAANTLATGVTHTVQVANAFNQNSVPSCAPLSEFFDGGADWLFGGASTNSFASATSSLRSCGTVASTAALIVNGCAFSFNLAAFPTLAATLPLVGGGPTGVVIDNSAALPGASQVYFGTIGPQICAGNQSGVGAGTGYCAIQASQNGLQ